MRRPVCSGLLFLVVLLVQQVGVGVMPCSTAGSARAAAPPSVAHAMHHGAGGTSASEPVHAGHALPSPAALHGPGTPRSDAPYPADPASMPECPGMLLCSAPAAPVPTVVALLSMDDVEAVSAEGAGDPGAWPTRGRVAPEPPPPKG